MQSRAAGDAVVVLLLLLPELVVQVVVVVVVVVVVGAEDGRGEGVVVALVFRRTWGDILMNSLKKCSLLYGIVQDFSV